MKCKILRLTALLMSIVFLSSCTHSTPEVHLENTSSCLRILVDLGHNGMISPNLPIEKHLVDDLKTIYGIDSVTIEFLSNSGLTMSGEMGRDAQIKRLRTEIMAGGGPDVFILDCTEAYHNRQSDSELSSALFNYPQKAMADGVFLPLNEFLPQATFLNWDDLIRPVAEAGKTEQGQLLMVPLAFTLPITVCKANDVELPQAAITWEEQLCCSDPVLRAAAVHEMGWYSGFLSASFGPLADYTTGELLISDEQLLDHLQKSRDLNAALAMQQIGPTWSKTLLSSGQTVGTGFASDDCAFCPVFHSGGGVTAFITSFAAVNKNTEHAEEAFAVIDLLFSHGYLSTDAHETINEELYTNRMPVCPTALTKAISLDELVDRITDVTFYDPLCRAIDEMEAKTYVLPGQENSILSITEADYPHLANETYAKLKKLLDES